MLTKKQRDLLAFIHKRTQKDGVPPSFEEMKEALDLRSKSGIHRLITALEERGFLRRLPHKARALEIIKLPDGIEEAPARPARSAQVTQLYPESGARAVPMLGRIAAGVPIEAVETAGMGVSVPTSMLGQGEHYALEVRGDSMIDAGISDGDVVVIRETSRADNGDIVVALIEDHEATLKKFRRANGMIALEAANPAYETRILRDDQVKVQGQLVGLIRTY